MIINREYLKKFGLFPKNYDLTEIMNYVDVAEKIWVIKTIGYAQYEELQQQVKDNDLTPENATLLVEAIYPYLAFAVAYESLPSTWGKLSEIGWTKGKSDNADSLDLKEMTYISQHIRSQVEARKDYAIQWIKDHIDYYPLIEQCVECECSCNKNAKLNPPNPQAQIYSTNRKRTDLK